MDPKKKSTIIATYLIMLSAINGGVGTAILLAFPFGFASIFIGASFILASLIFWGWACFGHKFF